MWTIANLDKLTGASLDESDPALTESFKAAVQVAAKLTVQSREATGPSRARSIANATSASIQAANSLLSAMNLRCSLAHPPADIDLRLDEAGDLVYRCYHAPTHEWLLAGRRK